MAAVAPTPTDLPSPFALASAFTAAWTEAAAGMARTSLAAWSALATSYGQAGEAYAALFRQAIDLERAEALTLADSADELLRQELRLAEGGTEDVVYVAEQGLARLARNGLIPLPD